MTRLRGLAPVADGSAACKAGGGGLAGAAAAGSAGDAGVASPPEEDGEPAEPGERRRRRRLEPLARSEDDAGAPELVDAGAGGAGAAAGSGLVVARLRRLRRRGAGPAWVAVSEIPDVRSTAAAERLKTLAPTSPSAQIAPSAVCTSTRQTAMAVIDPCTGGRFWVRVQVA